MNTPIIEAGDKSTSAALPGPGASASPLPERVFAPPTSRELLQAFLVLFVILNLAFFPALWGHRTLMSAAFGVPSVTPSGAYGTNKLPPRKFLRTPDPGAPAWQFEAAMGFEHNELLKRHHLPLWNPYAAYGVPWAAGMLSQPFYPLSFLESLDPTPRTIDWFFIIRLLIAGFFSYLFLRFFVGHAAALVAGIAFMLTGYFILFLNIDHLSTEILLPVVFYAMERLLNDPGVKLKLIATASVCLTIISGMPECTLLILTFSTVYFLYRLAGARQFRSHAWKHLSNFVLSNALGIGLAAFLLLPFYEFLRNGVDSHRPSIIHGVFGVFYVGVPLKELLLWLFPMALGQVYFTFGHLSGQVWGYFGIIVATLAILALISAARSWRHFWRDEHAPLILFFFASAVVFFLKFFGNSLVNRVGGLPLYRLVNFPKYLQPLLGFAMAVLAGLGAAYVFEKRARLVDVFAAPLASLLLIGVCCFSFRRILATHPPNEYLFYISLVSGIALLLLLTAALTYCVTDYPGRKLVWPGAGRWAVIGLLTLELTCNFIAPMFYHFTYMAPNSANPYKGAPYIKFLQQRTNDHFRIFARNNVLYPNWSSVFGLYDERYLYGVNWNKLFFFIRSFLGPENYGANGELGDRFTGGGAPYTFLPWKEQRFLQLSSTRYLISTNDYLSELSPLTTQALAQNQDRIASQKLHVSRSAFNIGGQLKDVLFEHPPVKRLPLKITVPARDPILSFSPAIDPAVWNPQFGDGVEFIVELQEPSGRIKKLFDRYIDPKNNLTERHWLDERIDLSRYRGKQVTLLFSTSGGPKNDTSFDWGGWGNLCFAGSTADSMKLVLNVHEIYRNDVIINAFAEPLPRASIFYSADLVKSDDAALQRLQDSNLDIRRHVVLVSAGNGDGHALQQLSAQPGLPVQPASITSYDSQRVVIHATLQQPGVVMLTDSNFPGWNAYLDGRRVPILAANYLFRGVLAPEGSHTIEFRYEPRSYLYGALISLCALFLIIAWVLYPANADRGGSLLLRPFQGIRRAHGS